MRTNLASIESEVLLLLAFVCLRTNVSLVRSYWLLNAPKKFESPQLSFMLVDPNVYTN